MDVGEAACSCVVVGWTAEVPAGVHPKLSAKITETVSSLAVRIEFLLTMVRTSFKTVEQASLCLSIAHTCTVLARSASAGVGMRDLRVLK
jgi:hypothetical protein